MKRVSVGLYDGLYLELKRLADEHGRPVSTEARLAIRRYVGAAAETATPRPISQGQIVALNAKASAIDRKQGTAGAAKRDVLRWATEKFGREIASSKDLLWQEASAVLDELELELNGVPA